MPPRSARMPSRTRLDRLIASSTRYTRRDVRLLLAQGRIQINGRNADAINQVIGPFDTVTLDAACLQHHEPIYLAMHKPVGIVSATRDHAHRTVLDCLREDTTLGLDDAELNSLHIVGRLDLNSSGLLLLTNDSDWSEQMMSPDNKVTKVYDVTVGKPLNDRYISAFAAGMYFSYEDITTQPARLEIVSEYVARVTLTEGRYHQIKRMFGRFRNPVLALHRTSIGDWSLMHTASGNNLAPGTCCRIAASPLVMVNQYSRQ